SRRRRPARRARRWGASGLAAGTPANWLLTSGHLAGGLHGPHPQAHAEPVRRHPRPAGVRRALLARPDRGRLALGPDRAPRPGAGPAAGPARGPRAHPAAHADAPPRGGTLRCPGVRAARPPREAGRPRGRALRGRSARGARLALVAPAGARRSHAARALEHRGRRARGRGAPRPPRARHPVLMALRPAWRLIKARRARHAFDGEGARLYGGRWNSAGTRMVYTAQSPSLAVLEILVHLQAAAPLSGYVLIEARVPEELIEALTRPPPDWRTIPAPESTRRLGDQWLRPARSLALAVPSVVSPSESLILLNPSHRDFHRVRRGQPQPFALDPRLPRR